MGLTSLLSLIYMLSLICDLFLSPGDSNQLEVVSCKKRWLGLSGWCLPRFALQLPGMIIKRDLEEVLSGSSVARACGSERDTGCVYLD